MMLTLEMYGFGSFFCGRREIARDIDLLILHQQLDATSIALAIRAKVLLCKKMDGAEIVILSQKEEAEGGFIARSKAIFLQELSASNLDEDIAHAIDVHSLSLQEHRVDCIQSNTTVSGTLSVLLCRDKESTMLKGHP